MVVGGVLLIGVVVVVDVDLVFVFGGWVEIEVCGVGFVDFCGLFGEDVG